MAPQTGEGRNQGQRKGSHRRRRSGMYMLSHVSLKRSGAASPTVLATQRQIGVVACSMSRVRFVGALSEADHGHQSARLLEVANDASWLSFRMPPGGQQIQTSHEVRLLHFTKHLLVDLLVIIWHLYPLVQKG